ncbi:MAG: class I SAM-dependent methyltransferase [Alphaproteobacteria bacterium]|nr:class I SAM-dependent methyltransferase [Alphaproteobacteria bacterium]
MTAIQDLGDSNDLAVIDRLVEIAGRAVVDAGCGAGDLARALAARGADVLAIEPDPIQAAKNAAAAPVTGVIFANAPAQAIPAAARSQDGVFFSKSLHHVPAAAMDAALGEARRVVKPDGFVCVIEPDMAGTYFELLKPFHDETEVRTLARAALARTADRLFESAETYVYRSYAEFPSFAEFRQRYVDATYLSVDPAKIALTEKRFAAGRTGGRYRFEQRMWLRLYRRPR